MTNKDAQGHLLASLCGALLTFSQSRNVSDSIKNGRPGHFIREWRRASGLSQEALAELAGVTHGLISQIERGLTAYTQPTLERLAGAFRCRPGDLLNGPPETAEQQGRLQELRLALMVLGQLAPERQARILGSIEDAARAEGLPISDPEQGQTGA
jgi:transcriptional regulator with XRE-family HTH domain